MELEKRTFAALAQGQVFLSRSGKMYRKVNDESAELIRLSSGAEPAEKTVDRFQPDDLVERVPKLNEE